ncbi:MAG: hypothetical protein Q8906_15510 [Bacillota bacterium]|nr:hypothetical protein [Bacillota bacterium]
MPVIEPDFTKSPYFVDEPGNWHLKPGAPKEIQEEFEKYLNDTESLEKPGTIDNIRIEYP